jgi:hypothetical protein
MGETTLALLQVAEAEVRFGGVHALRGVDLTVDAGTVTGVAGVALRRRFLGGASVCSGALAGGLALGFLPPNAQDVFIGAGRILLAFHADGVLPVVYDRFNRRWSGLGAPRGRPVPVGREERAGSLAGSRAA